MDELKKIGDISKYNAVSNYSLLKEHFDGVIVRIGYRGYTAGTIKEDTLFRKHMAGLEKEGIPYGFYFMSQAVTESEAIAEADYCRERTKEYQPSYPVYYDSELSNSKGNGRADNLDRRERTDIAKAFCSRLAESGIRAGVYASKVWLQERLYPAELSRFSIWVAQYNSRCGYTLTPYDMWQYTSKYLIPGLSCCFDRSYCYKDFTAEVPDRAEADTEVLAEGIHTYSLKEQGNKTFLIDGAKSNFKIREFRCKDGSDSILVDSRLVRILQKVRSHFGSAVSITNAYRTESYNKRINGAPASYHTKGMAADFTVTGISNREVAYYLEKSGTKGIGFYNYTGGFVHADTRNQKYYWQQDSRSEKYYSVFGFGSYPVYVVKDQLVSTVRYNDRNEYVKLLQMELGIRADGIFGPATEDAVRTFQKTHGLAVDGVAGYNTWSVLL